MKRKHCEVGAFSCYDREDLSLFQRISVVLNCYNLVHCIRILSGVVSRISIHSSL